MGPGTSFSEEQILPNPSPEMICLRLATTPICASKARATLQEVDASRSGSDSGSLPTVALPCQCWLAVYSDGDVDKMLK